MFSLRVCNDAGVIARHWGPALVAGLSLLAVAPLGAQAPSLPAVTVGAGVQTSFVHTDSSAEDAKSTNTFPLNSVRLYVNGSATEKTKFMFNTEYDGAGNHVTVLDAVAQFGISERCNIWVGRFLPPSDRANLYGPYYAHHWSVYTDGVQDGYPFVATGRDNGVAYWGQFGKVKLQGGVFDGPSSTPKTDVIGAGRVQIDFWDPEPGYYLNGTFYGDKNIFAVAAAAQVQDGNAAWNADLLIEKKFSNGGSVSLEGEYAEYDKLGGYNSKYSTDKGGYALASYLFPGHQRPDAVRRGLRAEDDGNQPQLRHQAVQRARDALLQEHGFRRRAAGLQAGGSRRAGADVTDGKFREVRL
jgi:hypothetical protein